MMLLDMMDDCKISHLGLHCLGQILHKANLPKAIEFGKGTCPSVCRIFFCAGKGAPPPPGPPEPN